LTNRALWCCLRLRFDDRELTLLRGAESVRGAGLAHAGKPAQLRAALNLAKLGRKLTGATPGAIVSLEEAELTLVLEALDFTSVELQEVARLDENDHSPRHTAVQEAFPELRGGAWRTFGITRELEALRGRLDQALDS
jgi:hypothetical protein